MRENTNTTASTNPNRLSPRERAPERHQKRHSLQKDQKPLSYPRVVRLSPLAR